MQPAPDDAGRSSASGTGTRLLLIGLLMMLSIFALRQAGGPDLGFHLQAGNSILDGEGWPDKDRFTYTVNDRAYLDTSWGYQVLIAAIERMAGAPGMVLFHVALVLAMFTLVTRSARLLPGELPLLLLLILLGVVASEPRFEVRPEILSYTLLALVLHVLYRHTEGLRAPLWLLPVIFLVWVNCHGLFILGWAALAAFVVGSALRARRVDRPLLMWCAISVGVGLLNPYGWRALTFPLELATRMGRSNVFQQNIGEFKSPWHYLTTDQLTFYLVPMLCYVLFTTLVLLSLRRLVRQRRYSCLFLGLIFVFLSFSMMRNIPALVVACLPGTLWGLSIDRLFDRLRVGAAGRRRLRGTLIALTLIAASMVSLRVFTDAYYIGGRRMDRFGLSWNRLSAPVDAAEYARQAGFKGRVLNHMNFGAYLGWALEQQVYIDSRLEVMGEEFFERYRKALSTPDDLRRTVSRNDVGWIIFPYRLRPDLLQSMSGSGRWRLVYVDHLAVIFVPSNRAVEAGESVDRLLKADPPGLDFDQLPGIEGQASGRWWEGFYRRRQYPLEPVGAGIFHYQRRSPLRASGWFAHAIRKSEGRYYELYNNLGASLEGAGRGKQALRCYRIYVDRLPPYRRLQIGRVRRAIKRVEASINR